MKYAIIGLNGKQYQVSEGQTLKVDSLNLEVGAEFNPKTVHFLSDGGGVLVGSPHRQGVDISLRVMSNQKDSKISVLRFRAKSRYRKNRGHRQPKTTLLVESIKRTSEKTTSQAKKGKAKKSKTLKEV